jgi:hypothetical protein
MKKTIDDSKFKQLYSFIKQCLKWQKWKENRGMELLQNVWKSKKWTPISPHTFCENCITKLHRRCHMSKNSKTHAVSLDIVQDDWFHRLSHKYQTHTVPSSSKFQTFLAVHIQTIELKTHCWHWYQILYAAWLLALILLVICEKENAWTHICLCTHKQLPKFLIPSMMLPPWA